MFLAVLSEFLLALKIESGIFAGLGLLLVFNVLRLIMVLRNNKSATIVTALILLVSLVAIIGLAAGIKPLLVVGLAVLPLELLQHCHLERLVPVAVRLAEKVFVSFLVFVSLGLAVASARSVSLSEGMRVAYVAIQGRGWIDLAQPHLQVDIKVYAFAIISFWLVKWSLVGMFVGVFVEHWPRKLFVRNREPDVVVNIAEKLAEMAKDKAKKMTWLKWKLQVEKLGWRYLLLELAVYALGAASLAL